VGLDPPPGGAAWVYAPAVVMMGVSTAGDSNWKGGGLRFMSGTIGTGGISMTDSAVKVGRTTLSCNIA